MNFNSIRFKTILVMTVSIVGIFLFIGMIVTRIVSDQFQIIENQKVEENVQRVVYAYKSELENLSTKLSDWSTWDDTYQFISDNNQAYVKSNLTDVTIESLKLSHMIFVNSDAVIVASIGGEIPDDLKKLISDRSILIPGEHIDEIKTGILKLDSGYLMFASRPILTSEQKGPTRGSLIFTSYLDQVRVDELSRKVRLPIEIVAINEKLLPNTNYVYGHSTMTDFFGKDIFQFKISYPRDITKQSTRTNSYFAIVIIISGVLFLIILSLYLDKSVLSKVLRLSSEVNKIKSTQTENLKIDTYKGDDEIAVLAKNVSRTINRLREAENRFTFFMDNLPSVVWIKDAEKWNYMYVNRAWQTFFNITQKELGDKTDFDLWPSNIVSALRKHDEEVLKNNVPIQTYEEVPAPDGQIHSWFVYKFPLILEGKKYIAGSAADITDRIKIENELTKRSIELEKMNSLMTGRELKMVELKREIAKLKEKEVQGK